MQAGRHMVANRHDLPAQPKGEKFPVNFLLFTESPDFALPEVVLAMPERRACPFGQTNPRNCDGVGRTNPRNRDWALNSLRRLGASVSAYRLDPPTAREQRYPRRF